jgi:hypothetical protein
MWAIKLDPTVAYKIVDSKLYYARGKKNQEQE